MSTLAPQVWSTRTQRNRIHHLLCIYQQILPYTCSLRGWSRCSCSGTPLKVPCNPMANEIHYDLTCISNKHLDWVCAWVVYLPCRIYEFRTIIISTKSLKYPRKLLLLFYWNIMNVHLCSFLTQFGMPVIRWCLCTRMRLPQLKRQVFDDGDVHKNSVVEYLQKVSSLHLSIAL